MDILKNNNQYYKGFEGEPEIIFQIKEQPNINIHVWDGYIDEMFYDLIPYKWTGLTKDYQECLGPWLNDIQDFCIVDVDEYYKDIKTYVNKEYEEDYKEENEVLKLILDLFEYAKENQLNVEVKID